uniref:Transposable element Tcb2 transposase n=1 Tax=Trepomonas sp. PC1 TaxID=1076344 RepID=A0A146KKI3_9EUKA|eukprot:JAP95749.1 Transposable element Tcb2 transposase [Trepomonas sp. PC1]
MDNCCCQIRQEPIHTISCVAYFNSKAKLFSRVKQLRYLITTNFTNIWGTVGQSLTTIQKAIKLVWCQQRKDWSEEDWGKILFTDESMFRETGSGRRWFIRYPHEKYKEEFIIQRKQNGGLTVMVWGGFSFETKTDLYVTEVDTERIDSVMYSRIIRQYAQEELIDFDLTLQQDNAPIHTSAYTLRELALMGISVMEWPPHSPDLNPIEHLWANIKYKLRGLKITDRQSFIDIVRGEWRAYPQDTLKNYIKSMPQRVQACIDAEGGWFGK